MTSKDALDNKINDIYREHLGQLFNEFMYRNIIDVFTEQRKYYELKIEEHEKFVLTIEELIINENYEDLLLKINNYKKRYFTNRKLKLKPKKEKKK